MYVILGQIAAMVVAAAVPAAGLIIYIVVFVISVIFILRFCRSTLGDALGIFIWLVTLVPFVGLIALLFVNSIATGKLKQAGFEVGLLGVDSKYLQ